MHLVIHMPSKGWELTYWALVVVTMNITYMYELLDMYVHVHFYFKKYVGAWKSAFLYACICFYSLFLQTQTTLQLQLDEAKRRHAGEMEELRRNIAELKGRNGDLISTIDDLNRKNADLENRNGDLKRLLEQTRDDRIKQALYENQVGGVTKNYVQRPV